MQVFLFVCYVETVFQLARPQEKRVLLISPVLIFLFHTSYFMNENACWMIEEDYRSTATLAEADSFVPIALCH